ncbi:MAG: pyridoxamine 5'-phosphate oxidase family protein [Actinomycetota bacterium]
MHTRRMETLTVAQSQELLATVTVGRVVFTDRGLPAILPVAFVLDRDTVVIRTADGSRLARAGDDSVLSFQADVLNPTSKTGWSVVVTGHARIERDEAERERISRVLEPWVPGIKDVIIRIPLTVVTGRRISAA